MTWSASKHLTCENTSAIDGFSVGKKLDMWHWAFQHRQLGHYIQEGRSVCGCRKHLGEISAYLFSKQQRTILSSGTRGPKWTGSCWVYIWVSEEIHLLIHSFQKYKIRSLVPMWASYLLSEWPNSSLSGDRITFIFAETSQGTGDQGAGLRALLSYTHSMKVLESGPVLPFSKQKHSFSPR